MITPSLTYCSSFLEPGSIIKVLFLILCKYNLKKENAVHFNNHNQIQMLKNLKCFIALKLCMPQINNLIFSTNRLKTHS